MSYELCEPSGLPLKLLGVLGHLKEQSCFWWTPGQHQSVLCPGGCGPRGGEEGAGRELGSQVGSCESKVIQEDRDNSCANSR